MRVLGGICGAGIPRLRGGKLVPMLHGREGAPNAEFCVGDPKPMPRRRKAHMQWP